MILGGATQHGYLSDAILQLICIPVLLLTASRLDWRHVKRLSLPLAFLGALVALPLLQLLPLPPDFWTELPNRQKLTSSLTLIGAETLWRPISIAPHATWQSFVALLVPVTVFLSVAELDGPARRSLCLILLLMGLLSSFLGFLQISGGSESAFRFFNERTSDDAVGFFANRNHFSALLYSLIPFTAIWIIQPPCPLRHNRNSGDNLFALTVRMSALAMLAALISAQTMTRSRAGLTLSVLALAGSFALAFGSRKPRSLPALLVLALLIAATIAAEAGGIRLIERFSESPLIGARQQITETTLRAIDAYFPFGSGIGAFRISYGPFEQPANVLPSYINRAHSDVLEWILEAGLAGLILMAIFLKWLGLRTLRAWQPTMDPEETIDLLPRAGCLVLWALAAHSLVDYPLRTTTLMALFAFSCALLFDPDKRHHQRIISSSAANKT